MNKTRFYFCVLIIYFGVNSLLIFFLQKNDLWLSLNGDANGWMQIAQKIYKGVDISQDIWWPPLYPLIASVFFKFSATFIYLALFQTALFLATLYIMKKIMTVFPVSHKLLLIFLAVYALIPSHLILTKIPLGETVFLFLYASYLWLLIKFIRFIQWKYLFMSLALLIMATFTKPTTLYLHIFDAFVVLCLMLIYKKIAIFKLALIFISFIIIPSIFYTAWSYRNYLNTGILEFANVKNYNLLADNFYHSYNYITYLLKVSELPVKGNIGSELTVNEGEKLRHFLLNDFFQQYLTAKYSLDVSVLDENRKNLLRGELGQSMILKYIYVYVPIHYIKSLYLFAPNNFELFKPIGGILGIQSKSLLIASGLIMGFMFLSLFIFSLVRFVSNFSSIYSQRSDFLIINFLLLTNIFYLLSIIGPTAFDDGGRFSFIFLFPVFCFIAINVTRISSKAT